MDGCSQSQIHVKPMLQALSLCSSQMQANSDGEAVSVVHCAKANKSCY